MKIEAIANGSLRVWLSEEEQAEWGLSVPENHCRIRKLVRQVWQKAGRTVPIRLAAEILPLPGGCLLLVSPQVFPNNRSPSVYHIPNEEALLELALRWGKLSPEEAPFCSLYSRGEGYDLAVYPVRSLSAERQHLLLEYGDLLGSGEGIAAYCEEHGCVLGSGFLFTALAPDEPSQTEILH